MRCVRWAPLFVLGCLFSTLPVLMAQVPGPEAPQIHKPKHNGGKDDIQAIGQSEDWRAGHRKLVLAGI